MRVGYVAEMTVMIGKEIAKALEFGSKIKQLVPAGNVPKLVPAKKM